MIQGLFASALNNAAEYKLAAQGLHCIETGCTVTRGHVRCAKQRLFCTRGPGQLPFHVSVNRLIQLCLWWAYQPNRPLLAFGDHSKQALVWLFCNKCQRNDNPNP